MTVDWSELSTCVLMAVIGPGLFALVLTSWIAVTVIKVSGNSMLPTLHDGDRVVVLRLWPQRLLRKGQVVIIAPHLTSPPQSGIWEKRLIPTYVKRIAALQGETFVTSLTEISESDRDRERAFYDSNGLRSWSIPPEHIFVRSDNPWSVDSLIWGPIPCYCVLGVVVLRLPAKRKAISGTERAGVE